MENNELKKFYITLQQDIRSEQLSEEEGGTLEQLFTQEAVNLLSDTGETENVRVAYHESLIPRNRHKINAYAISDNYETLDLFITIFKSEIEPSNIPKKETDDAAKLVVNFFRKAEYKDFAGELEESSEIFDLAHTLSDSEILKENLVRVNAFILTDGIFSGEVPANATVSGYPVYYKIIDINYLYNISEKSHMPIEINFKEDGFLVPCIQSASKNDEYQSYLAIISGDALVNIYERYGARLLEQNVRSFLQFTGKVNGGIRNTIIEKPHMFLAFNNGIAATADDVKIEKAKDGNGFVIANVSDFQIVNGGQTTASIYHTWKKDKKDVSGIQVQVKLSVVKNKEKFSDIVSQISQYANTQNKVSVSDLSSNRPYHIELEKLSRSIWAPPLEGKANQTRWFYDRARGQYKNARNKEGFTKSKMNAFDLKNPKAQVFSKEDLAKYVNSYEEIVDGKKILIGPHFVVRGNQKNYAQFMNFNLQKNIDSIYFEDIIAKAILFRSAEKKYGVKPNSIGDMRYITVPYSIAYLTHKLKNKIDLYKIWKAQSISDNLNELLYSLMQRIESFIKSYAPGSLYGEWAKKEDCWLQVKKQDFDIDWDSIKSDLYNTKTNSLRRNQSSEELDNNLVAEELNRITSIPDKIWYKIEEWGKATELLSIQQQTVAWNMPAKIRNKSKISDYERNSAIRILDIVLKNNADLLLEIDNNDNNASQVESNDYEITLDLVSRMVIWDRKNKKLKPHYFKFMHDITTGAIPLNNAAKKNLLRNLQVLKGYGFK